MTLEVFDKLGILGQFWILFLNFFRFPEALFGAAKGVIRTRVGYAGGTKPDHPTYHNMVSSLILMTILFCFEDQNQ
jgi:peptide-methionine (S)-S-oxide reductase